MIIQDMIMKKTLIFLFLLGACVASFAQEKPSQSQGRWFLGGSAGVGFRNYFTVSAEARVGYQFNDRVAIGTGLGAVLCVGRYDFFEVTGIAEPFVRVCVWNNENIYIDLHAMGGFEFTDELKLCQVGIRPSIRFRVSENVFMAADLVVLGAQYTPTGGWRPSFSLTSMNGGLRMSYHF